MSNRIWTDQSLTVIGENSPYRSGDGTFYPASWDKSAIPDLVEVVTTAPPDGENITVTGFVIEMVDGVQTQVWQTTPIAPSAGRRAKITAELAAIDAASARPLRAIAAGTATQTDHDRLIELENQAVVLRAQLSALPD